MVRQIDKIPSDTMRALVTWHWPRNVRELENFIERAVILSRGPSLRAPLAEIRADAMPIASGSTLAQVEREHIVRVLREGGGVVTTAATRQALLQGILDCGGCGRPMSPTYTCRGERRYRYYVCRDNHCTGQTVAATAFESSLIEQLRNLPDACAARWFMFGQRDPLLEAA